MKINFTKKYLFLVIFLYTLSFFFSIFSFCIPYIFFVFYKHILKNKTFCIAFFLLSFLLFFVPLVIWIYLYVTENFSVIFYFLLLLFFLYFLLFFYFHFYFFILSFKSNLYFRIFFQFFFITLLYFILYELIGYLYTPGCICPLFYPLLSLAHFNTILLPFFSVGNAWIYLFFYQLICYYYFLFTQKKGLILYSIICIFLFFQDSIPDKETFYWLKENNLPIKEYIHEDYFIFPENSIFIKNNFTIKKLIKLAITNKRKIISGISWQTIEKNKIINKHGVICIDITGKTAIREKKHYLRFTETKNSIFQINDLTSVEIPEEIYICSEFFFTPLSHCKKKKIIIASIDWANNYLTKPYIKIMILIYKLKLAYNHSD